jgi:apolipoprotein D and lipocalin family protein
MNKQLLRTLACCALCGLMAGTPRASAQGVTPVPQLDLTRFTGSYFEIARLPIKSEKKCVSGGTILYALGDKKNSFMSGTFCKIKNGSENDTNAVGKVDKRGGGRLDVRRLVFFHTKYWVLAAAPDYSWVLVGYPNHKGLWILSRKRTLQADVLQQMEATAASEGFKTARLVMIPQPANAASVHGY